MATAQLDIEGLAAQLYEQESSGLSVWWHVLNEDVREDYRRRAYSQIAQFLRDNPHPWDTQSASPPSSPVERRTGERREEPTLHWAMRAVPRGFDSKLRNVHAPDRRASATGSEE